MAENRGPPVSEKDAMTTKPRCPGLQKVCYKKVTARKAKVFCMFIILATDLDMDVWEKDKLWNSAAARNFTFLFRLA